MVVHTTQPLPDRGRCAKFCEHLVQEAVTAERAGYDGVFVPERHGARKRCGLEPLLALMAMAMKTERIKLARMSFNPLTQPSPPCRDDRPRRPGLRGRLILGSVPDTTRDTFSIWEGPQPAARSLPGGSGDSEPRWTGDRFDGTSILADEECPGEPEALSEPAPPIWHPPRPSGRCAGPGRSRRTGALVLYADQGMRQAADLYREEAVRPGEDPWWRFFSTDSSAEAEEAKKTFGAALGR